MKCLAGLVLCAAWVAGAATVVDLVPQADTCVAEAQPSVNSGTTTALYVASQAGGSFLDERVWLRFPLAAEVPPGATILSAELRLYVFDADDADALEASVHGCDNDTWQETALTWANQPAFAPAALATATLAPAKDRLWYAWDVTAFATNQWAGDQVASLVVKAVTEGADPWSSYKMNSREFTPAFRPVLRITYAGQWPATDPIRIFHVNDAHARIVPHEIDVPEADDIPRFERVGGAAYIGAKILEQKAAFPNSLVLDAGDMSEGNPVGDLRGNGAMVDFYKLLDAKLEALGGRGIDAVVVGNHDVRDRRMIDNLATNGAFAVLSMNICHKGTLTPYFTPFVTVDVAGRKVGILGYTNDESSYLDGDTVNLIDVVPCDWSDADPGTIDIKPYVQQLRAQGCDFVVLLSHMGQSRLCTEEDALLEYDGDVPPPEVVVSGHWHSWIETAWQPAQLRYRTTVVESGSYLQYLGDLTVNGDGRYLDATQHIIRCEQIVPDPDIANLVTNLIAEYNAGNPPYALDQIIGYSAVDLTMDKDKWWSLNEYPWSSVNAAGAWICDAMCWKAESLGFACDLAIQSGGGIRRDVPAGPITYLEIYECYPWEDDDMVRVQLTGQQIWDTLEEKRCGASISHDWIVYADDGVITHVVYNGAPLNLAGSYNVAISAYMYLHEGFAVIDPIPEYIGHTIRASTVEYTAQFGPDNPLTLGGPRYVLDTEMAGEFEAVVTMPDDAEDEAFFEALFVRLLRASDGTVRQRGRYASADLVRADGSINPRNLFGEVMLYRSHLGFPDGLLRNGDIIRIRGEGGFHAGLPEFIDQAGIYGHAQEWDVIGHDPSLAQPACMPTIAAFWDEAHEGRYVRFHARKSTSTKVQDATGQTITVYKPGGYYTQPLPGVAGDLLELTGVSGNRNEERRFRCHTVRLASEAGVTNFPPWSCVRPVVPSRQAAAPCLLEADAGALGGPSGGGQITVTSAADSQVVEGAPDANYGATTFMYVQSAPPTDTYRNERSWVRFNLAGSVNAGTPVQSAVLRLYCWRGTGPDLAVVACGSTSDTWAETGITWANQPVFGAPESSVTLRAGQNNVWYEWDVTSLVSNSVATGDLAISLVMKAASEGLVATHSFGFDGREYQSGTYAPELKLTTTAPPGAPETGLTQVAFFYRHAADGRAWSGWQPAGSVTTPPWQTAFGFPAGPGHYEFYSQATDTTGGVEPPPLLADAGAQLAPIEGDPVLPHDPVTLAWASDPLGLSLTLSIAVEDPNGDTLDVSFYDSTGALIGVCTAVASGQTASVYWFRAPDSAATGWYVVARDSTGRETRSVDVPLDGGTALTPGDITILGYRTSAPDGFAFVTWKDLPGGTTLGLWDHGANADSTFRLGEGSLTWTAPVGGVPSGTVVVVACPVGAPASANLGVVAGSLDRLTSSGDQLFAAIGGAFPPAGDGPAFTYAGTLLYGLNVRGDWLTEGDPEDEYLSALPAALQVPHGNAAIPSRSNGDYNGPRVGKTVAEFKAYVHDLANWRRSDNGATFGVLDPTPFGIGAPEIVIVTPDGSVPYETSTLSVSGTFARVVGDLAWTNSLGGDGVAFKGAGTWSAQVPLAEGANAITVSAVDAAPRTVIVTRLPPASPVVVIVVPVAAETTVARDAVTLSLTGTAAHCVGTLAWTNGATGAGGVLPAGATWTLADVTLGFGPNAITVRGTNVLGAAAADAVTIHRPLLAPYTTFTNTPGIGGAECLAYDASTRRLAVTSLNTVRLWHLADPAAPVLRAVVTAAADEHPTSVAAHHGRFAISFARTDKAQPGRVRLVDADGDTLRVLDVGCNPDMVCFTPDGARLLVANEGEPTDGFAADPEGSVSIVELGAGLEAATVRTASFTPWNSQREALRAAGVRLSGRGGAASVAEDLEPEYIAVAEDGATAWVTLQENNAIATLDVVAGVFTRLDALGTFGPSNTFDASDRDGGIHIQSWPVRYMPQPDGLAAFAVGDACYLVTANEGDQRDWGAFPDFARVKDLTLDPGAFPDAAVLKQDANLGRLRVATDMGDDGGDGDLDALYTFGARSFGVWRIGAGGAVEALHDSGSLYEETVARLHPELWNIWDDDDGGSLILDQRSDNRGPEPEGVAVGLVAGRRYAFVSLERCSGLMVHDLADPAAPRWIQYATTPGDIAPEAVLFIPAAGSPIGRALVAVANEGSGTVTLYDGPAEDGVPPRAPFVEILQPTQSVAYVEMQVSQAMVTGVVADAVGFVTWSNLLTGAQGTVPVAPAWTLPAVELATGTNRIVVAVTNATGSAAFDEVRVVRAAPALLPGDLAIVGWNDNGSPDVFLVATLVAIPAGTTVYFTDNGWTGSRFRGSDGDGDGNETLVALTAIAPIPAGRLLRYDVAGAGYVWHTNGIIPGSSVDYKPLQLGAASGTSGDQVCAFLGTASNPLANPLQQVFLLDDTGAFETAISNSTGDIPPGLAAGSTALTFNFASSSFIAFDFSRFAGQSLTREQWQAAMAVASNWKTGATGTLPVGTFLMQTPQVVVVPKATVFIVK